MAKMGRPVKEINWSEFEKLCALQCTLSEIAAWFCCSEDTIERRVEEEYGQTFAEVFSQKKKFGRISLRRTMFQKAQEGNATLLIWLSKQHLGMKEKTEIEAGKETRKTLSLAYPENPKPFGK